MWTWTSNRFWFIPVCKVEILIALSVLDVLSLFIFFSYKFPSCAPCSGHTGLLSDPQGHWAATGQSQAVLSAGNTLLPPALSCPVSTWMSFALRNVHSSPLLLLSLGTLAMCSYIFFLLELFESPHFSPCPGYVHFLAASSHILTHFSTHCVFRKDTDHDPNLLSFPSLLSSA